MKKINFFYGIIMSLFLLNCKHSSNEITPRITIKEQLPWSDSLVIDGYFNNFSFSQQEKASIYINAKKTIQATYLGIYDIENRLVDSVKCNLTSQKTSENKPYENGFGYVVTTTYTVPKTIKSGLYFLAGKLPFIIKNTSSVKSKIAIVHPSNTDIAYNNQGGMSLYFPSHQNRARVLSTQRPWIISSNGNPTSFYKWLKTTAYESDFLCDADLENYATIEKYDLLVIAGHSEYWTRKARENFDKFVDSHHNALLLSGNSMYWQVRLDNLKNQLICYKYDAFSNDPEPNILLKTGRWEEPLLNYNPINSIGSNYYKYGGFSHVEKIGFGGFQILNAASPLLKGLNLANNEVIKFNAIEYDGANLLTLNNTVSYDNSLTNFYKIDLIGYDLAVPDYGGTEVHKGTLIMFKKKQTSGIIINVSSSNWCVEIGNNEILKRITNNAFEILLKPENNLFL